MATKWIFPMLPLGKWKRKLPSTADAGFSHTHESLKPKAALACEMVI